MTVSGVIWRPKSGGYADGDEEVVDRGDEGGHGHLGFETNTDVRDDLRR